MSEEVTGECPMIFREESPFFFKEGEQNYEDNGNREFWAFVTPRTYIFNLKTLESVEIIGGMEAAKRIVKKGQGIRRKLC